MADPAVIGAARRLARQTVREEPVLSSWQALLDYLQAVIAHTRATGKYAEGLSPRGGLALLAAARAWAWLDGRDHVIPEDVQNILPPVAGHRLHATSGESGRALHGRELVAQLIAAVPVP